MKQLRTAGWTGTDLKEATKEVTIEKGSTGNREYKATWIQNAPDTYALTVLKGTGVATVSEGGNYEFGIYDMHGNVFEWCSDWYDETYDSSNLTDPTGPDTGYSRVLRGGSWNFYPYHCTSWYRFSFTPSHGSDNFGFRLALVPVALE